MAKNAITQITKNGKDTVAKYITAYAPPTENDTAKYVRNVAAALGVQPHTKLTVDSNLLLKLIRTHLVHEVGKQYSDLITDMDIYRGISLVNEQ